jgi:thiosulfate reductase cytochrome b subunit
MKKVVKTHSLAIRWMHWFNFSVLAIMIWSGLLIYWANDVYAIKINGKEIIKFFPQTFYEALNLPFRLAEGMAWHFAFMWLFLINGFVYVIYLFASGAWRMSKYNRIQRLAYYAIILMGLGSILTGLAIYKPVQFGWLCWLCGGYEAARLEHFILTIGYCLFFLVHIIQVMRAGWNNFRGMVTGFEVVKTNTNESTTSE